MFDSLVISIMATLVLFVIGTVLAHLSRRRGAVGTVARDTEQVLGKGLRVFQIIVGVCLVLSGVFSFIVAGEWRGGSWSWMGGVVLIALGIWQIHGSSWIIF